MKTIFRIDKHEREVVTKEPLDAWQIEAQILSLCDLYHVGREQIKMIVIPDERRTFKNVEGF